MYSLAYSPSYASGGVASLARQVQSKGRGDDTVLVHMTPGEVQGLEALARAHGGHLTRNPHTGLYEAGFLKSIFRPVEKIVSGVGGALSDAFSGITSGLKDIIKPVAKVAPFILPFIPIPGIAGLSPLLTRALLSGALGGFSGRGGFDLKRGLTSGLMSYGLGSLAGPAAAGETGGVFGGDVDVQPGYTPSAPSPAATPTPIAYPGSSIVDSGVQVADLRAPTLTDVTAGTTGELPSSSASFVQPGAGGQGLTGTSNLGIRATDASILGERPITYSPTGTEIVDRSIDRTVSGLPASPSTVEGLTSLAGAVGDTALTQALEKPVTTAMAGMGIYSGIKTKQELEAQKAEAERILANQENEKQERIEYAKNILRDYPLLYQRFSAEDVQRYGLASGGMANDTESGSDDYNYGGLAALANGGALPPRYLRGGGDGMSDSIPANISGKQEARLADGEFVVPADVVSHIGNGSSNAGAKKLYAMMDRVRQARTGKKSQAPAVRTSQLMPA